MAKPRVYTIPAHRAFADALVAGLMRRTGGDPLTLARGLILLPNNRARRAIGDAFVRASGRGLLMPRMVALGDPELDEAATAALDPADATPIAPAVAPLHRRMILARLVVEERARAGAPVDAGEAVQLAAELARTLDQLLVEEVAPGRLRDLDLAPELSVHWQRALETFSVVLDRWPGELARLGYIDQAERRSLLLARLAARWKATPPPGFVCAAGVTDSAPAVARLLRCVAELPGGTVVFAGVDREMPEAHWDALGPHQPDPDTGLRRRAIETHPQFHLKLLLDRMGIGRAEVRQWREGGGLDATLARGRAVAHALAPAEFTAGWPDLPADQRRLTGIAAVEVATPAEEAQAIALALREVLETPGRTAALVTPDRALAARVAAHCARWNIAIDDSAGRPLSVLPPGTLLLALAEAAAQRFAPVALLALLKHPLVRSGEGRLAWLDRVRLLDRRLRGPRPAPDLAGLDDVLAGKSIEGWWQDEVRPCLAAFDRAYARGAQPPADLLACLRETAQALCGDALWAAPAGREAARFLADLEAVAADGPALLAPDALPALLRALLDEVAVRLPRRGPLRLAIYGLIEARLQTADLMILGGLNEGTWPNRPAPDPWLAPRIRIELGLPGLERRVGVAAHDLGQALGAPQALVTRTRRDASGPTIASRFWLRLAALAGERFERAGHLERWALALDDPGAHLPATRPAPQPAVAERPRAISVTEVDRLQADPFAFYARRMLGLAALDAVDADPTAAWRGSAVHDVLEHWAREDNCRPDALRPRALALLAEAHVHPMLRALWQPRLVEAIDWIAARLETMRAEGREVLGVEGKGEFAVAGVTLSGRFDRIDRLPDGALAIVDYKTGKPPTARAVAEGFSLQLGLLGAMAEAGAFANIAGTAAAFEYWSLAKKGSDFGFIDSPAHPAGKNNKVPTDQFVDKAVRNFTAAAERWLIGDEPFTAKLKPEYAPYAEYDQLMRRDEWYGRERG